MSELYIGLMSGTSMDGVDGVIADFAPRAGEPLQVLAHAHVPFDAALGAELLALNSPAGTNELQRAALAANALAQRYAAAVAELLATAGLPREAIVAIGAHGQTVRHRPQELDGIGFTLQLNQPALLAELTGIDVVCDFRSRDVAAGGQGAPLAPAFHRVMFGSDRETRGVLNLGGISNLTVLRPGQPTLGFDCGPGNALMDHWCQRHAGRPYDDGGAWAASGRVIEPLLSALLADPYFAVAPPKSTGRDLFNPEWLAARLLASAPASAAPQPADVQATLAEFTAAACANDLQRYAPEAAELLVCGGGAFNTHLLRRIAARVPSLRVLRSDERGLPPTQVEGCAFAWLARAHVKREALDIGSITGARGPRVLGALYPR
ncbi:MAG TPA: anhydro-N-acetylmuramic acid kinase [Burkholderiaceae bacterium]|nr:anhydro-N-acetylmuramic acid kinase [Burkholderiaceae bacterium]